MYANSESALARLQGYMDRVREDDNARDGFDVVQQERDIIVPRRNPAAGVPVSSLNLGGDNMGGYVTQKRRRHWTDY